MQKKSNKKLKEFTYASGRRRNASVRVRLYKGDGESTVNGILIGKYFPGEMLRVMWSRPFEITDTLGKYHISAKVLGGGKQGQLNALMHATAKALVNSDNKFRSSLKKAGLLSRDQRIKERRKVGKGGKARRSKQSPKR